MVPFASATRTGPTEAATPHVGLADLARRLGVSVATVSLALRNQPRISIPTRQRVSRLARQLGYVRNPLVAHLMAELRHRRIAEGHHTIAVLNAHPGGQALQDHPSLLPLVEGCGRRARQLGYHADTVWLGDPQLTTGALTRILTTRDIHGVIIAGLHESTAILRRFSRTWQRFACVVTGVRTLAPALNFVSVDHYMLILKAVSKTLKLGYRRPALVVDEPLDRMVDSRYRAGMWCAQQPLPERRRVPGFFAVGAARRNPRLFRAWLRECRPDVLLTYHPEVRVWAAQEGIRVPRDLGVVLLDRRSDCADWACMDQRDDKIGEAAADLLVGMLDRNETGVLDCPRGIRVNALWSPGATIRRMA